MKVINTYIQKVTPFEVYRYHECENGSWWCEKIATVTGQRTFFAEMGEGPLIELKKELGI